MISRAMEDYLKAIYLLAEREGRVSTTALAQRMRCSAASVTGMIQKLSELKLVDYQRYQGVRLTASGAKVALEVIRHHRLLELYLQEALGFSWDQVHDEAEALEHVISEELEEKIDRALGYPTHDPHGHPIPTKEGLLPEEAQKTLWDNEDRRRVCVQSVDDGDAETLRYLGSIGVFPETRIQILRRSTTSGRIEVSIEGQEYSLTEEMASKISVSGTTGTQAGFPPR